MSESVLGKIRECGFSFDKLADACPELALLKGVPQNPDYHAEGDVYCHTEMVCGELTKLPEWRELTGEEKELLFLAAAFHDIGKVNCTKQEDGKWTSPKHTIVGEKEFRRMAYRENGRFGLTFRQREIVAKLIRYHGMPVWFLKKKRPEFELIKAAESIPLRLLYLLSKADVQGRLISTNADEHLGEYVELFADHAKELSIWDIPHAFADAYTKYQYFHKEDLWQGAELYDDTEFDVILMSGLPLAGKDTWIGKNGREMSVISLDAIREKLGIPPSKKSDKVAHVALEQAKELLRRKEPFIWNATNIVRETREKLVKIFAGYGARVHILYLEVPYSELLLRNQKRERYIPKNVLEDMIRKLEIPAPWEAYEVEWIPDEQL